WLYRYRLPRRAQFVRDDLWQRRPDALACLDLGDRDGDAPVSSDLDIIAKCLLAGLGRELAGEMLGPQRKTDDEPDPCAAANQQCPTVDPQFAYSALSARRSILPVPSLGSGSGERMIRCGILNFASLPSRNARKSSSPSCAPFFK